MKATVKNQGYGIGMDAGANWQIPYHFQRVFIPCHW